jgi:hypothetical protein
MSVREPRKLLNDLSGNWTSFIHIALACNVSPVNEAAEKDEAKLGLLNVILVCCVGTFILVISF